MSEVQPDYLSRLVTHVKLYLGPEWGLPTEPEHQYTFLLSAITTLHEGKQAYRLTHEKLCDTLRQAIGKELCK